MLGEVWPRTARNVREIQTIAQNVLGLSSKGAVISTDTSNASNASEGPSSLDGEGQYENDCFDVVASLDSINDLCGFYNLPNLDFDV